MGTLFATVAVVCTMSACNDYVIDTANTATVQQINTSLQYNEYQAVWQDEKGLTNWLNKYQIGETVFEIVSIDIESQTIEGKDVP